MYNVHGWSLTSLLYQAYRVHFLCVCNKRSHTVTIQKQEAILDDQQTIYERLTQRMTNGSVEIIKS